MNIVKELRERSGMQQKELAILVGVSRPTVSEWEHGKKDPSGERLRKLSKIFNVDIGTILGYGPAVIPIQRNSIPIVGEIACGTPTEAVQNIEGYTDVPEGIRADFALRCKGDSMEPTFKSGDLVLIRIQPDVENGQIAAVNVNGETTLKHVYHQQDGLLLIADNPSFSPIYAPANSDNEITIHGLAIGYIRLF
jgi:repressor LexA